MFDQTIIRICLIVGSLFTAGFILRRVRLAKVQIEDTIFWLVFSAALLILAIFPGIAYWAANLLGFISPINFVYIVIIFLLLVKQFFMSIRLSQLDETKDFPVEPVNVAQITGSVLESLEKSAGEKHVTVVNEVDDITISGVQRLVYEIVYNLCDNAIRYNREGGSVTVRCKAEGDKAVLSVSDTGIGIPAEHRARIFERFYRVDTSHSRSTGGTGLGLSIVKHACQVLRAQIELESEEGKGSVFTIIFNK